eukprot:1745527-Ditylum_brightwellii.AAC.1
MHSPGLPQRIAVGTRTGYNCTAGTTTTKQHPTVDPMMLMAISNIAGQQAALTKKTGNTIVHLLNYVATLPLAVLQYTASGMTLHIHSDT